MSEYFKIAETETFQNNIETLKYKKLYNKICSYIYPQLRTNPFFGPSERQGAARSGRDLVGTRRQGRRIFGRSGQLCRDE